MNTKFSINNSLLIGNTLVTEKVTIVREIKVRNVIHGFFSAKAYQLFGGFIYKRPDGSEVLVTCVDDNYDSLVNGYKWPDKVYMGLVLDNRNKGEDYGFVRRLKPAHEILFHRAF